MKTALIAGIFLLALTYTITDALDKKQDICTISDELNACLDAAANFSIGTLCSGNCRSELTDYFKDCNRENALNQIYILVCGGASATTVTLFTIVSAVLVTFYNY